MVKIIKSVSPPMRMWYEAKKSRIRKIVPIYGIEFKTVETVSI